MSVPQFLRQISLKAGDEGKAIDLSNLRIHFSIRRGDISTPNTADIRVYNVSQDTAQTLKEFTRVRLEAGYEGNMGVIFDGTVVQVRRGRESQTDTYIDITAADGDSAYNFAVVSAALTAGSTLKDQLDVCLKSLEEHGVTVGYIPALPSKPLARGVSMYGAVRDYLDLLTREASSKWSIQDGKLYIIPLGYYLPGEAVLVNAATGMVGLPEQVNNGINVRMLLNPSIKIGRLIKLDNRSIQGYRFNVGHKMGAINEKIAEGNKLHDDGLYYVMIANHSGDTRGNAWYTDLKCLSVDASVPADYLPQAIATFVPPIKPYG